MFPDPTRHHLMGVPSPDERKSLRKRAITPFFRSQCRVPKEVLSKYGESDSAWRQNCTKMLSLSGGKIEVVESAVILGRNCCQVTAKSGVFDCTVTPGTVSAPMGVSFRPVLILAVPERIAKRAESLSFSVNCSLPKGTG